MDPSEPPPVPPPRVCPAHGLMAGLDGRCVICRRGQSSEGDPSGTRFAIGGLLVIAMILVGVLLVKGARGRAEVAVAQESAPTSAPSPTEEREDLAPGPLPPEAAGGPGRVEEVERKQRAIEAEMLKVPVRLYSTTKACGVCDAARAWMKQ